MSGKLSDQLYVNHKIRSHGFQARTSSKSYCIYIRYWYYIIMTTKLKD